MSADGTYSGLSAELEIGAGALQPTADTKPVRFDRVRLAMSYDPGAARVTFSDLSVDSKSVRLGATADRVAQGFHGELARDADRPGAGSTR